MKKNIILPSVCLGFLAVLALFGFGCHRREKPTETPKPTGTEKPVETAKPAETEESYEGRWVDVNGSTALEIKGDTMTVTFGSWTDEYRFRINKTEYRTTLSPAGPDGDFGVMSELEVRSDGSLWAYEMVLDAEGHTYHFVRPEALAEEKEIRDLSTDAPKEIASTELVSFSLSFRNEGGSYGLGESWPSGSFSWELESLEDGSYRMDFRVMGDSYVALDFSEEVSEDYAGGLARLLADLGIPAYNGYHMANSVSKPGYSLYAEYASGEELSIRAEGDAGDECVFDLPALLAYAARQAIFPDEN